MPKKLEDCVKKLMAEGKTEDQAYAICNAAINDSETEDVNFKDNTTISDGRVVSIRDGVMEYYGSEIGHEPGSKLFKVYRSPEEVQRISALLSGLPITNGHVDPEGEIEKDLIHGKINGFEIIDAPSDELNSSIAVQHDVDLSENMLKYIQANKPESSLGYKAKLIPHKDYDFEQVGLVPHHLAVVTNGRCGETCKFKDEKVEKFLNEDGTLNLEAFLSALGMVMEKADDAQKMAIYKAIEPVEEPKEPLMDQDEPKKPDEDPAMFKDAIAADAVKAFIDSQKFIDAVAKAGDDRAEVITKAKPFLDAGYTFKGKPSSKIMLDTLAAEYKGKTFEADEVSVAFKMLDAKPDNSHKTFGDVKPSKWDQAKTKEL